MSVIANLRVAVAAAVSATIVGLPGTTGEAVAAESRARICQPVDFDGVADFRLVRIRASGTDCETARRAVRGARLHQRWRSLGFASKVSSIEAEVATHYRCSKGQRASITFRTA